MNLHALNRPRPWGLVHPYGLANLDAVSRQLERNSVATEQRYYEDILRYYRQNPVDRQAVMGGFDGPTFETVDVRVRGPREDNARAATILRELDWQYAQFRRYGIRPTDMQRAAFVIDRRDWDALRVSLGWREIERHFGRQVEGAYPTYRDYPLVIR